LNRPGRVVLVNIFVYGCPYNRYQAFFESIQAPILNFDKQKTYHLAVSIVLIAVMSPTYGLFPGSIMPKFIDFNVKHKKRLCLVVSFQVGKGGQLFNQFIQDLTVISAFSELTPGMFKPCLLFNSGRK
jgi:hypothetical protein